MLLSGDSFLSPQSPLISEWSQSDLSGVSPSGGKSPAPSLTDPRALPMPARLHSANVQAQVEMQPSRGRGLHRSSVSFSCHSIRLTSAHPPASAPAWEVPPWLSQMALLLLPFSTGAQACAAALAVLGSPLSLVCQPGLSGSHFPLLQSLAYIICTRRKMRHIKD